MLFRCYIFVSVLLPCCDGGDSVLFPFCFDLFPCCFGDGSVLFLTPCCFGVVSELFRSCFRVVSVLLLCCCGGVLFRSPLFPCCFGLVSLLSRWIARKWEERGRRDVRVKMCEGSKRKYSLLILR